MRCSRRKIIQSLHHSLCCGVEPMVLSRFQPKFVAVLRCSRANRGPRAARPLLPFLNSKCSSTIQEKCEFDPQQMGIGTRAVFVAPSSTSPACSDSNISRRPAELSLTKKRRPPPSSWNARLIEPPPVGSARETEKGEPVALEISAAIACQVAASGAGTTAACAGSASARPARHGRWQSPRVPVSARCRRHDRARRPSPRARACQSPRCRSAWRTAAVARCSIA